MDNLSSIQYFLPEFLIILLALAVILFDLVSFKKWINPLLALGCVSISLLLYQLPSNAGFIFNNMLINDSFSYYFK
jgi:glucan phosphoethanolaminetransferase (alkaline phosphatase superfamily)